MNIPIGREEADYSFEPEDVDFRLVTGPTKEVLNEVSPRHDDYLDFKTEYVG